MGYTNTFDAGYSFGKEIKNEARKTEAWEAGASGRELAKEQNDLALDVNRAMDDSYGGRANRAKEMANQAKYLKELSFQTMESQNAYRNAQSAKMSSSSFDKSSSLYSLGGKSADLAKMSEHSGGSQKPNPDGSFTIGTSTYKSVNFADLTETQMEEHIKLVEKWEDMIDTGEIEVVNTKNGEMYKIQSTGQMFNPDIGLIKDGSTYTSPLDPGVALGTARRMQEQKNATEPIDYKGVNKEASGAADPILRKYGLRVTSGFRSPEHNKSVGGAKHSKHMEGHAMDVHWKGKTIAEKKAILQDFKDAGFTGFGIGHNTIHVDRRKNGASWSYIGGSSTGGGKMPSWASEVINGPAKEAAPMKQTPVVTPREAQNDLDNPKPNGPKVTRTNAPSNPGVWSDKPLDSGTFKAQADQTLAVINRAIDKKAATSEQKELGVLLGTKSGAEFAQQHGITTVEQFAQYKDVVKAKNAQFVKDQHTDDAIKKVSSYEDYVNDDAISFSDKASRITKTTTMDLNRLEKAAKDAGTYNKEAIKGQTTAVSDIRQAAPAMLDVAKLYSEIDVKTEYKDAWDVVKQKIGEYKASDDPRKRASEILTVMASASKGRATAVRLKAMSGTAASDEEYARTLLYSFGREGSDKNTILATIQEGIRVDQKGLEGTMVSAVENGGYKTARNAARLHNQLSKYIMDPAFKSVNETVSKGKAAPAKPVQTDRRTALLELKQRANANGKTMAEQAKIEGFK